MGLNSVSPWKYRGNNILNGLGRSMLNTVWRQSLPLAAAQCSCKTAVSEHYDKDNNRTCVRLVIRRTSSCRIYSTTQHNGRRRGQQRGKWSTLTVWHICHRPRIPFGHVLIELRCEIKHCKKREGCNKEKKDHTHHTSNNNKVPFQTTIKKNKSCENCDPTNLELSYIFKQHTTTEGAVANREGNGVHLLPYIVVTAPVFHLDTSWLNADA